MNNRLFKYLVVLILLIVTISCNKQQSEERKDADKIAVDSQSVAKEPVGYQIPQQNVVEKQLFGWINYYRQQHPALSLDQFALVYEDGKEVFAEYPSRKQMQEEFIKFLKSSPGKDSIYLDVYSYERELKTNKSGKKEIVAGGSSSEVAIVNINAGTRKRILFCGTPCTFEDGIWLNTNEVIVAGVAENDELKWVPTLWHIVLGDKKIYMSQSAFEIDNGKGLYLQQVLK